MSKKITITLSDRTWQLISHSLMEFEEAICTVNDETEARDIRTTWKQNYKAIARFEAALQKQRNKGGDS